MENEVLEQKNYKLTFVGDGGSYFGIIILNWLLSLITLGFYYPWAKAKELKYLYSSTILNNQKFAFNGSGNEMFKGFIKSFFIFLVLFAGTFLLLYFEQLAFALFLLYFGLFTIIPIAIHGAYRYRFSRTTWRGIRFGYRGNRTELCLNFYKWLFFTIITLGVYGSWMEMNMRNYLLNNLKFGDVEFKFKGKGFDYFLLNIKGLFFTIISLGVYSFWYFKNIYAYNINNLSLFKEGKQINFKSTISAGTAFNLFVVNYLILIFTLGLGYAWVMTRSIKLILRNLEIAGTIELDNIQQTELDYTDATGEDMSDFLDINLI